LIGSHVVLNFLFVTLRVVGWLVAMAIALAASSASIIYAFRYGAALAASDPQPWLTGAILAVADIVKIGLPALIVALWMRSHKATARILGFVFVMLVGLSLWATTSITAIERATSDAKSTSSSKREADLRSELADAKTRVEELGSPPPLASVEAEIDGFKTDIRWRTTEACNPLRILPGARRFCEQAALKQSAREKAAEADKLRARMNEIRHTLTSPTSDPPQAASPELAVISAVFNWRTESVGFGRAVFFAIALELLGAFVPSAVWFLRPELSANSERSSSGSRPTKVADAHAGTTAPRPSPRPSGRSSGQSVKVRTSPAKRGRKRNSNVLDFVREFRNRHGRSPNIPEMRARFPDLHKSTLWRATQIALESVQEGQKLTA